MSRVTEQGQAANLEYIIQKAKNKMDGLQIQGASIKKINRISDDPAAYVEVSRLKSEKIGIDQFHRNASFATSFLEFTESALQDITELVVKAKDLAIQQSSDFYNPEVRKNVAQEVKQIKNQMLSLANKQLGGRYIFGGTNTLTRPFPTIHEYQGNNEKILVEIAPRFYIPINISGRELFFPLDNTELNNQEYSLFSLLHQFEQALETGQGSGIQMLLEGFDASVDKLITERTKLGSIYSSIQQTETQLTDHALSKDKRRSFLEDADVAELFSQIEKQNQVLQFTYKSGVKMMNNTLMNHLR